MLTGTGVIGGAARAPAAATPRRNPRGRAHKYERLIAGAATGARHRSPTGARSLNFCANNYLGLADHPDVIAAAQEALDAHGFGMATVRFICGTQDLHKQLEKRARRVLRHRGRDPLRVVLRRQRRPVRDAAAARGRDHLRRAQPRQRSSTASASARRSGYATRTRHGRPGSAPAQAKADGARHIMITTDGVFSMDGFIFTK